MKPKQYTHSQHFVPCMYLKRFVNPKTNKLSVYDKKTKKFFKVSPKNICCENDLYEVIDEQGDYIAQNKIENIISYYERVCDPVFETIVKKAMATENKSCLLLNVSEKAHLALFIALQFFRHPLAKKEYEELCEDWCGQPLSKTERSATYFSSVFLGENLNQETLIFKYAERICECRTFSLARVDSPNLHLFTCDFPTMIDQPNPIEGVFSFYLPLTPKIAVFVTERNSETTNCRNRISSITEQQKNCVLSLNLNSISNSPRFIIADKFTSPDKDFIEQVLQEE